LGRPAIHIYREFDCVPALWDKFFSSASPRLRNLTQLIEINGRVHRFKKRARQDGEEKYCTMARESVATLAIYKSLWIHLEGWAEEGKERP
jgi:hypothetical protein